MIEVTRLNGKCFFVNAEMIVTVEETPDTVIVLSNEKKLVVSDKAPVIIERIIEYKRQTMKLVTIKQGERE